MNGKLYSMNLFEILIIESDKNLFTSVMRVPGGWIFRSYDKSEQIMGATFVPFNNEFM